MPAISPVNMSYILSVGEEPSSRVSASIGIPCWHTGNQAYILNGICVGMSVWVTDTSGTVSFGRGVENFY